MHTRWTIRNVDETTREKVNEVRETSGLNIGELIDEAVEFWYLNLPYEQPTDCCNDEAGIDDDV